MLDERLKGASRQAWNRRLKGAAIGVIGISGLGLLWFAEEGFMNHEPSGRIDLFAPDVSSNTSEILGVLPDPASSPQLGLPLDRDPRERFKEALSEYQIGRASCRERV